MALRKVSAACWRFALWIQTAFGLHDAPSAGVQLDRGAGQAGRAEHLLGKVRPQPGRRRSGGARHLTFARTAADDLAIIWEDNIDLFDVER